MPSSVVFEASSAAQSATSPALLAGFGTAVPLEHCSVYWVGMIRARASVAGAGALEAVAWGASVVSREMAIADISASSVRAVVVRIACLDIMYSLAQVGLIILATFVNPISQYIICQIHCQRGILTLQCSLI